MSNTKHTPGPWENDGNPLVIHTKQPGADPEGVCRWWAALQTQHGYATKDELEANARLIVAAPCLLEALEKIRGANAIAALGGYTDKDAVMALFECNQDAAAAIAKAKGGSK